MMIFSFLQRNGYLLLGAFMLLILLIVAFFGPYFPFIDLELQEMLFYRDANGDILAAPYEPSEQFLFGSDRLGRDIFSMIVIGAKDTLLIVLAITIIRYLLAFPIAFFAHKKVFGFSFFLNWLNVFFSYIPTIIIVALLVTIPVFLFTDIRPYYLIMVIAVAEIGRAATNIKEDFDEIAKMEFVTGGTAIGIHSAKLIRDYYWPFIYRNMTVNFVTDLGKVMFLLGQLGFVSIFISQELVQVEIGQFEIRNDSFAWPMLLMEASRDILGPIWIPMFPALAITYCILTFNVLALGLQNFFHKRTQYI